MLLTTTIPVTGGGELEVVHRGFVTVFRVLDPIKKVNSIFFWLKCISNIH
jgi:hypothetical protein